jgi:hypothetical protein
MRLLFPLLLLAFLHTGLHAQSLEFLGLKGVRFGMKSVEMKDMVVILDSTSVYKDTNTYLRNTRCQMYFRPTQELQLTGFSASRIEYEFCDGQLGYVFVYVSGKEEIDHALNTLKSTFTKLGCKGKSLYDCPQLDSSAKGMRLIVNIDRKKQEMSFVLIQKK